MVSNIYCINRELGGDYYECKSNLYMLNFTKQKKKKRFYKDFVGKVLKCKKSRSSGISLTKYISYLVTY